MQGLHVPRPFGSWARGKTASEVSRRRRELTLLRDFSEDFFEVFGKSIDGGETKVLVGNLSLIGKLFEIYFVRLIGTPNQNSKNGPDFGSDRV